MKTAITLAGIWLSVCFPSIELGNRILAMIDESARGRVWWCSARTYSPA